jgi:hypothetical protein
MTSLRATIASLLLLPLAACGPVGSPRASRLAQIPVQEASLSADGRTLTLKFVGAAPFDRDDPCTYDYEAAIERSIDELRFSVFEQPHPGAANAICDLLGFRRPLDVEIDPPFIGHRLSETSSDGLVVEVNAPPS